MNEWNDNMFAKDRHSVQLALNVCDTPTSQLISDTQVIENSEFGGQNWFCKHLRFLNDELPPFTVVHKLIVLRSLDKVLQLNVGYMAVVVFHEAVSVPLFPAVEPAAVGFTNCIPLPPSPQTFLARHAHFRVWFLCISLLPVQSSFRKQLSFPGHFLLNTIDHLHQRLVCRAHILH